MKKRTGEQPSGRPKAPRSIADHDKEQRRVVATGTHSSGMIGYDELGQPRWTWISELGTPRDTAETFDYLKALDIDSLSIEDEPGPVASKETGYDPYDTASAAFGPRATRRG